MFTQCDFNILYDYSGKASTHFVSAPGSGSSSGQNSKGRLIMIKDS
jgi:hypothetical protein